MTPQPPTPTLIQLSLPPEQLAALAEIDKKLSLVIQRNNAEAWLTDELVAERFHCSTSTIQRWRKDAKLPYRQLGDKRLYVPAEVDRWFASFSPDTADIGLTMVRSSRVNEYAN
jgi:Helix-turn-helix domain